MRSLLAGPLSLLILVTASCTPSRPSASPSSTAWEATETTGAAVTAGLSSSDGPLSLGPNVRVGCRIDGVVSAVGDADEEAELSVSDREIASRVATCFTKGPLRGRFISLVGRADRKRPTGRLSIGQARARALRNYLVTLGVEADHITDYPRADAPVGGAGSNERSLERRVELELAN
jgi:peptidoglycan-associated lipoprotein